MIVISGALVLVSIVLLLLGIFAGPLAFVYASIATTVVAIVLLVLNVLARRKSSPDEVVPASLEAVGSTQGGAAVSDDVVAVGVPSRDSDDSSDSSGTVLVVAGRPRYHVDGCRYLNGKDADEVAVSVARADGFTPCGVCKPDEALAAAGDVAQELPEQDELDDDDDQFEDDLDVEDVEDDVVEDVAAVAVARKTTAPRKTAAKKAVPAKTTRATTAAKAAPVKAAGATKAIAAKKTTPAKSVAGKPAAAKPAAAKAAKVAPATATAKKAAPAKAGSVVVLPDADKFHKSDCRYVRGDADASSISRAQAARQGFKACGVCKP